MANVAQSLVMINLGHAVQRIGEKCKLSYLSSSKTGTQSNSGGK